MKNLFTLLLFLFIQVAISQQTYNLDTVKTVPKTEEQLIGKSTSTQDKAIYNNTTYVVYKSVNNKLFIVYKNRSGNWSKKYIK